MSYTLKNNEKGRSMVEILGVLAVTGILTVVAIDMITTAFEKQKANKTIDQLTQIISNAQQAFAANPLYENLDNKLAIKFNIVPKEMIADAENGIIVNLYGGNVIIEGSKDDFKIVFDNLPKDVSVRMGTQDWGLSGTSLQQIKLN